MSTGGPWCEHSTQSWEHRSNGGTWCNDCRNYVDGWRRAIRQLETWIIVACFLAPPIAWAISKVVSL